MLTTVRSTLLGSALAIGLSAAGAAQDNVLLVIADDLGVDAVGCYAGALAPPTPVIDALAAGGVRFTQAHTSPACSPSRAAILTGRHGFRTGVTGTLAGGALGLDATETLLPQALASTGYARALIGKWHLGVRYGNATPNMFGWPHFVGTIDGGIGDYSSWPKVSNGVAQTSTRYATTDQIDDALTWIGQRTTPWLLVLSLQAPHQPFHAPPAHLHTQNLAGLSPQTTPRPFFAATVQAMDTELGRLLTGLGTARQRTNIVFMADNGTDGAVAPPTLGAARAKGSLYDGGTRVPLIVAGPAAVNPGRTSAAMVHAVDLFPTLLQLCGAPLPPANAPRPIDGTSLLSVLADTTTTLQNHVYVEITDTPLGAGYAVKDGRFQLLRYLQIVPQHQEMYDVVTDPQQQNDLLAGPRTAQIEAQRLRLESLLASTRSDGWVEGYGQGCAGALGVPRLRAQTMPRLGSWFYVQVENAPLQAGSYAVVAWGQSRTQAAGLPLPFDLSPFGMPGCQILQSWSSTVMVSPQTGYAREWVPANATLLGLEAYAQAIVADGSANAVGYIGSRGLRCVIGS